MKHLLEYLKQKTRKYSFTDMIGDIIFELDESSVGLINPDSISIITEEFKKTSGRIIWKSKDEDTLRLTSHAADRQDRPIEKGGDGEHIDLSEIVIMFKHAWNDIMEMFYDGYLKKDIEHDNSKWVIQCKCYLEEQHNRIVSVGARPQQKHLWAVWVIEENYSTGKIDIKIITIFRGEYLKHRQHQRRLVIANNGYIKQILPK